MSIRIERRPDRVAVITVDHPSRRNALTYEMFRTLADAWPELEADRAVRVVVLRGEGGGAFCSGADLSAGLDRHPDIDDLIARAFLKSVVFPKPVVAAVNGHCVAGGLELALAADLRIVDETARIGLPEVRWGIFPSGGAALKLADQIGYAAAMDLLLTGRLIDGREAARIGLMTQAVAAGEVERTAFARAEALAANAPLAVSSVKRFIAEGRSSGYADREGRERELVRALRASPQPAIGIAAFLAKRSPDYGDA